MLARHVFEVHGGSGKEKIALKKTLTVPATSDHFAIFVFIFIVRSAASSLTLDTLEPDISRRTTGLETEKSTTYL